MTASPLPAEEDGEISAIQREVGDLRRRLEELEARLQFLLEKKEAAAEAGTVPGETGTDDRMAATEKPATNNERIEVVNTEPPPGPDISAGGRIYFDAIYNSRSGGGGSNRADQAFNPAAIPVEGSGEDHQTAYSARDSRLWVKAHSPTAIGDLAGYIEIDFVGGGGNERVSNSYNPRLRHAYAVYKGLTLGQTYTGFLNLSAYPETNDSNGPAGILNIRQPLLRYQHPFHWGDLTLGLEQPETTLTTAGGSLAVDDDRVPDIVTRLDFSGDWGNWSLAGLIRQIRHDSAEAFVAADSQWGGAVSASGRIYIGDRDNLRFSLAYGNALGRYLSFNSFDDGVLDGRGNITLTDVLGGFLSYQHWWDETLRSSLTVGYARADHDLLIAPAEINKSFYSAHINLLWSPTLNTSIGIEWLYGHRKLEDGRDGELNRFQFTSSYKF
ncbi:MAG: DcaP family trimeric outer membrane transporter [Gammaproteobacteria bacterium]